MLVGGLQVPALGAPQTPITVFVGGAMTEPLQEAGAAFTRSSGRRIVYVSDTTGALLKRLAAGEKADLMVVAAPAMDTLQKENRVVAGEPRRSRARADRRGRARRCRLARSVDAGHVQGGSSQRAVGVVRQSGRGRNVGHIYRGPARSAWASRMR